MDMNLRDHAYHLGSLLANLQSLEFLIRAYLASLPSAVPSGLPHGTDIYTIPVGGTLPANAIIDYDALGQLIEKYNESARQMGNTELEATLVDLRDALAHGRISVPGESEQLRLIKFSKPRNGVVTVTFNAVMDEAWFHEQKSLVRESMFMVAAKITPPAKAQPAS